MTILEWWRWLYREHRIRWHILLSAVLIVGMFAVVNGISVIDKANAEPQRICTHNPDGSCKWTPRKMARKFKAGYFYHAHGVAHLFTPRARHYVVHRTAVRLKHAPKAKFRAIRRHQNAVTHFQQSRSRTSDTQRMYCEAGSYMCVSKMSWEDVAARGKCVGRGYYDTNRDTCKWGGVHPLPPGGPITLSQWKALGAFTLCSIGLAAGVAAEVPTAGAATVVVANVAATCLFSFWAATN